MHAHTKVEALGFLPLPLPHVAIQHEISTEVLAEYTSGTLGTELSVSSAQDQIRTAQFSILNLGDLQLHSGRTSPVSIKFGDDSTSLHAELCYGGQSLLRDGTIRQPLQRGTILLTPNQGISFEIGCYAGIGFRLERRRLQRTLQAISHNDDNLPADGLHVLSSAGQARSIGTSLLSLMTHINTVSRENTFLATGLGLDDQIYRTFAISLLMQDGRHPLTPQQDRYQERWTSTLDTLVDYIQAHTHTSLTLTDLEIQSHYTGRQLQRLFQGKFNCTPMQFVRRTRLHHAMERLSAPKAHDTVIRIARECGYHHGSNFSVDFQQQFGIRPSLVLRQARSRQARQDG